MILILLVIGALCFFLAFMFTNRAATRALALLVSGVVLIGSIVLMVANYHEHYGMKKVTTTTTQKIYSASGSSSMNMALYKQVGTSGKNNVYIYDVKENQKAPSHTKADEYTTNHVNWTNKANATLTTKVTRWEYKSDFYSLLFKWSGMDGTMVKRVYTFNLPKTWVKLSTTQAAKLKKLMGSSTAKAQMATQAKAYITAKVQAAMMKNPQMTEVQRAKVTQQAQAEFQAQALKKAVAQLN